MAIDPVIAFIRALVVATIERADALLRATGLAVLVIAAWQVQPLAGMIVLGVVLIAAGSTWRTPRWW